MLRTLSVTKAHQVFLQLKDSVPNIGIIAKENTPVSQLTTPLIAPNLFKLTPEARDNITCNTIVSDIMSTAEAKVDTDNYDKALSNFIQLAAPSIKATIYLTKSVAIPMMDEISAKVEERLHAVSGGNGLALNIVEDDASAILSSQTLKTALERYIRATDAQANALDNLPVHTPRDSAAVLELIKVGYDNFDGEILDWVTKYVGSETLLKLYVDVFSSGSPVTAIRSIVPNSEVNYPIALLGFLLSLGLMNNLDDNINMSKSDYEVKISQLVSYFAGIVNVAISQRDTWRASKRLVVKYPLAGEELTYNNAAKGIILVNREVYQEYLEAGGSPEAIMGSYLTNKKYTLSDIMDQADNYVKAYNTRVASVRSDSQLRKVIELRRGIVAEVAAEIANANGSGKSGYWANLRLNQEICQRKLTAAADELYLADLNDVYGAVRRVVLATFFSETDVCKLLSYIDAVKFDDIDIQSAANIAIIDYIVDWFLHQVNVIKN